MTEKKTVLREANNEVTVVGVLNEKNLEKRELERTRNGQREKYNVIMGSLSVRTNDNEVHDIRFFANELTNAGKENRQYKSLETIQNEYISVADLKDSDDPDAKPTELSIVGSLELNEYYGADGQLRQFQQVSGRFANRIPVSEDGKSVEGKAEYDVEGVVKSVIEEFDKDGDETGRAKIELLVPLYGGKVVPLNFVVGENGKEYVMDNFESGSSVRVYGDIVNFRKVTTKTIPMGFGQDKIQEKVSYTREFTVNGGTVYEESVHDAQIFDLELLKQAGIEREKYLENLLTRSQQKGSGSSKPKTGFGSGAGAVNKPKEKTELDKAGIDLSSMF